MSEHEHVFTYTAIGDITSQPNAVLQCDCGIYLFDAYRNLKRQLAEAKIEIEADDRNVNNLMDQVNEMSKEIEAMRTVVEAVIVDKNEHLPERIREAIQEYESRKQK